MSNVPINVACRLPYIREVQKSQWEFVAPISSPDNINIGIRKNIQTKQSIDWKNLGRK